jgi:nucleoside-diphosphate-sugar epimerase
MPPGDVAVAADRLGGVRVLVTGGGFIGSHLAERLLERGAEVLDSFTTGRRENLSHLRDVEIVEGDVQSFERAHDAVRGCDVVLHQAALPSVPRSGEVFNVACGERVSLNSVLSMLAELAGIELDPDYQPGRPGKVRHSQADIRRARETFGYRVGVQFAEGLRQTFENTLEERRGAPVPAS